jgi:hypothetical protein
MAKRTHQNAAGGIALLACLSLFARPAPARAEAAEGAGCPTISQADLPVLSELDRRIAAIQTGGPHQSKFLGTFTGGVSHTSRALAQLESKVAAYCQKPDARDGAKLSGALTEISGYIQYQDDNFHYSRSTRRRRSRRSRSSATAARNLAGSG